MKIISRLAVVVLLLGALGFGSYCFGQYVLSERLFGTSVVPSSGSDLTVASRSTEISEPSIGTTSLRGKARVDVEVLPANEAGPGPEPPSIEALRKTANSRSYKPSTVETQTQTTTHSRDELARDVVGSLKGSYYYDEDGVPHLRRRKRKSKPAVTTDSTTTARTESTVDTATDPDQTPTTSDDDTVRTPGRTVTSDTSTRTAHSQPRVKVDRAVSPPADDESKPAKERTEPAKESPIPRPEKTVSSDSPIPNPE